jgi:hypothetical protein
MSASASAPALAWKISAPAPLRRAAARRAGARALPRSARADASIIDGKAIAADVREEVRVKVAEMKEKHGKVPGACPARASPDPERATRPLRPVARPLRRAFTILETLF